MTGRPDAKAGDARRVELAAALARVEQRVALACRAAGRPRGEVVLIAVSKTWPASDVAVLHELGVGDFGENKDVEAASKTAAVPAPRWHFVGRVQTNKARSVASYADVVHSVDRDRVARALSVGAGHAERTVLALLQVSLDGNPARGGASASRLSELAALVAELPGLELGGVMAVAPLGADPRQCFDRLVELARELRRDHPSAQIVSAGMSADLEAAVAAGATHLRVGTALFGHRPPALG